MLDLVAPPPAPSNGRRGGRRLLAATLTVAAVALAPSTAAGAPPERTTSSFAAVLDCTAGATDIGMPVLDAYLGDTPSGAVTVFQDESRQRPIGVTGESFLVTYDGTRLQGSGDLLDPETGTRVGDAAYDLQVRRGETEVVRTKSSDGNQLRRTTAHITTLHVSGTLDVLDRSLPIECSGFDLTEERFVSDPDSEVGRDSGGEISCEVTDAAGRLLVLNANSKELSAVVFDADGTPLMFADGHDDFGGLLTREHLGGHLLLFDLVVGEPVGEVELSADVVLSHQRDRVVEKRPNGTLTITSEAFDVRGDLTLTEDLSFSLDGCRGVWRDYKWQYHFPGR